MNTMSDVVAFNRCVTDEVVSVGCSSDSGPGISSSLRRSRPVGRLMPVEGRDQLEVQSSPVRSALKATATGDVPLPCSQGVTVGLEELELQ